MQQASTVRVKVHISYFQFSIAIADEAELAEAKLATSLGSCIARVTNTTGCPLS